MASLLVFFYQGREVYSHEILLSKVTKSNVALRVIFFLFALVATSLTFNVTMTVGLVARRHYTPSLRRETFLIFYTTIHKARRPSFFHNSYYLVLNN